MSLILIFLMMVNPIPTLFNLAVNKTMYSWSSKILENDFNFTLPLFEGNYLNNTEFIKQFNQQNEDFELGFNEFSHLKASDFVNHYCGAKLPKRFAAKHLKLTVARQYNYYNESNLPESISWKKYASPVRDQGNICGSCWAFSAIALVEAHNRIRNNKWNHSLAPQYLIDCDRDDNRCIGGWPTDALKFLKTNSRNRAPIESNFPYKGRNNKCYEHVPKVNLNIKGVFESDLEANEKKLRLYLANYGPIIVIINVDNSSRLFQNYKKGIFYDKNCRESDDKCKKINHAMLLVGYGVTDDDRKKPYYLIQNCYGKTWGEDGYIRMSMNRDNNCNIACFAIFIN